jgi:hypothetical protein
MHSGTLFYFRQISNTIATFQAGNVGAVTGAGGDTGTWESI